MWEVQLLSLIRTTQVCWCSSGLLTIYSYFLFSDVFKCDKAVTLNWGKWLLHWKWYEQRIKTHVVIKSMHVSVHLCCVTCAHNSCAAANTLWGLCWHWSPSILPRCFLFNEVINTETQIILVSLLLSTLSGSCLQVSTDKGETMGVVQEIQRHPASRCRRPHRAATAGAVCQTISRLKSNKLRRWKWEFNPCSERGDVALILIHRVQDLTALL